MFLIYLRNFMQNRCAHLTIVFEKMKEIFYCIKLIYYYMINSIFYAINYYSNAFVLLTTLFNATIFLSTTYLVFCTFSKSIMQIFYYAKSIAMLWKSSKTQRIKYYFSLITPFFLFFILHFIEYSFLTIY